MNSRSCSSCVPSKHGKCKNKGDRCVIKSGLNSVVTVADHLSHGDGSLQDSLPSGNGEGNDRVGDSISEDSRMVRAFGANVLNSDGGERRDEWSCRWKKVVMTHVKLYDLPRGCIGKEFVGLLADEIRMLCNCIVKSERLIVFCGLLLQRDNMVKIGSDIRRLLKRRMDTWRKGCFDELLYECIRCA